MERKSQNYHSHSRSMSAGVYFAGKIHLVHKSRYKTANLDLKDAKSLIGMNKESKEAVKIFGAINAD